MAAPTAQIEPQQAQTAATFAEQATLAYGVPAASDLVLDEIFSKSLDARNPLECIETRDSLFFGTLLQPSLARDQLLTIA